MGEEAIEKRRKRKDLVKEVGGLLKDIEEVKEKKGIIYFSKLKGKYIFDSKNKLIARLEDAIIAGGEKFPEVSAIVYLKNRNKIKIPWQYVESIDKNIKLTIPEDEIPKKDVDENDILLGDTVLDKQLVDINGLKVIRVNDILLTKIKNIYAVVSIDVGFKGILRRLGLKNIAYPIMANLKDHLVPWDNVEPLQSGLEKIHLKIPCSRVSELHPADIADLLEELSYKERSIIFKSLNNDYAAKILQESEPEVRKSIIKSLSDRRVANILDKLDPNIVVNIISILPKEQYASILKLMKPGITEKVQELMNYEEDSAARIMSSEFIALPMHFTVEDTLTYLRNTSPHKINYLYVINESQQLVGVVSLRKLVLNQPSVLISTIMDTKLTTVDIADSKEDIINVIAKYDLLALPVVDFNNNLKGVIYVDDVLNDIIPESWRKRGLSYVLERREQQRSKKRNFDYHKKLMKDINQIVRDIDGATRKHLDNIKKYTTQDTEKIIKKGEKDFEVVDKKFPINNK